MGDNDPMEEESSSTPSFDLHSIQSQINELSNNHRNGQKTTETFRSNSDSDQLLSDCSLHIESKMKDVISEYSDVASLGIGDLDAYMEHLKEELNSVTAGIEKANKNPHEFTTSGHDQSNLQILQLENEIEKKNVVLKSLQDFDSTLKRFDAIEQIEDMFTGLKVIEFDSNFIRLSLQTNVPKLESLLSQQNIEDVSEPSELYHELLIEVMDGTMELKSVEIFPNDIYIGDIVEAVKSFRELSLNSAVLGARSSLEWFVGKVQDKAILSTMRRFVVKSANKSRHSFEFLERDNTIIAHLAGEVDAFIKVYQGWPMSKSPLRLMSLKSTNDRSSRGISLNLLCKVEEAANSLDEDTRQSLPRFVEGIEKVLVEQMQLERHYADSVVK
ncbi:hypothetical protein ACFE04_013766 [Oxalis oulophora]